MTSGTRSVATLAGACAFCVALITALIRDAAVLAAVGRAAACGAAAAVVATIGLQIGFHVVRDGIARASQSEENRK